MVSVYSITAYANTVCDTRPGVGPTILDINIILVPYTSQYLYFQVGLAKRKCYVPYIMLSSVESRNYEQRAANSVPFWINGSQLAKMKKYIPYFLAIKFIGNKQLV